MKIKTKPNLNPSKSPFNKGDFKNGVSLLVKGGSKGGLD